uniref:Uncharacterized protein n=1 Tax=viral metagenome TaxID=1070528 RepID=A0A6M3XJ75_9ZZZZ
MNNNAYNKKIKAYKFKIIEIGCKIKFIIKHKYSLTALFIHIQNTGKHEFEIYNDDNNVLLQNIKMDTPITTCNGYHQINLDQPISQRKLCIKYVCGTSQYVKVYWKIEL